MSKRLNIVPTSFKANLSSQVRTRRWTGKILAMGTGGRECPLLPLLRNPILYHLFIINNSGITVLLDLIAKNILEVSRICYPGPELELNYKILIGDGLIH